MVLQHWSLLISQQYLSICHSDVIGDKRHGFACIDHGCRRRPGDWFSAVGLCAVQIMWGLFAPVGVGRLRSGCSLKAHACCFLSVFVLRDRCCCAMIDATHRPIIGVARPITPSDPCSSARLPLLEFPSRSDSVQSFN
jgi:hypothetical protein